VGSDVSGDQPAEVACADNSEPDDPSAYTGPTYVTEAEQLKHGTETERQEALERLAARVESRPDDLVGWNEYALALATVGRNAEAIEVFESLVEAEPESLLFRMNLATTLSNLGHVELARAHIHYLAEHAADERERAFAHEQLETLDHSLLADDQNERLAGLQIAALRRRREVGSIDDAGRVLLARRLMRQLPRDEENLFEEAKTVLEDGLAQHPDAVPVLELLVGLYLRHDPDKRLDQATARLELLAPDSPILEILNGTRQVDSAAPILPDRINELMQNVFGADPALRDAAVRDLGAIVARYPEDAYRRSAYAFALAAVGRMDEARSQAERAARDAGEDHATHLHIGQVLWMAGDEAAGRHHLDLARRYARDDDDRRDVETLLAELDPHG
jgi:tetratricopeptide (TPR) repeat protein